MMEENGGGATLTSDNNFDLDESLRGPDDSVLLSLVQTYDWHGALARMQEFPEECKAVGVQERTPLHVACDHDAPAVVIQVLVKAYPEATLQVGTTDMNPLHITCSSEHASAEVVRVLLVESSGLASQMASMCDVDGDTPLHAACRCGAPLEVLQLLLHANPGAVNQRDYEGLTPLLRLWVRYFVILGDDVIEGVKGLADLTGELGEAWKKTMLLLYCAYMGSLKPGPNSAKIFRPMHAAVAVDCPRRVVKIAAIVYRDQLLQKDENGMTPLLIASQAPIYKFHDIADDDSDLEDKLEDHLYGDDDKDEMAYDKDPSKSLQSVIDILMEAEPSAASIDDPSGKLPLQHAIDTGKRRDQGVKALSEVDGNFVQQVASLKVG
jgi:hypothetical protein